MKILSINNIEQIEKQLEVKEMEPTIFYFDDNLKKIELYYNNANRSDFITFSFIFNDFASFEITYYDNHSIKRDKSVNSSNHFSKETKETTTHSLISTKKPSSTSSKNNSLILYQKVSIYLYLIF